MTIDVYFLDSGRTAQCKPDPRYPEGMAINLAKGKSTRMTMTWNVPYPAPRKGIYRVVCQTCGFVGSFPVAGLHDDPRTVTLACHPVPKIN
jgi:hypothetical protein